MDYTTLWLKHKAALACFAMSCLFLIAVVVFAARSEVGPAVVFFFWTIVYGISGLLLRFLPGSIEISPIWRWLEPKSHYIAAAAPYLGFVIACGYVAVAFVFPPDSMIFLVNLFWAVAFIAMGLMVRILGFRRSAAILLLIAGGIYSVASVYWIERERPALFWFNAPWGTLCIILGFFIDRKRDVNEEMIQSSEETE